jgi:acyl-CoA synthetase (AMP-forming)/AMP-acid ligase II
MAFSPNMLSNPNRGWKTHAPVSHMARHILCDQAARHLLQANASDSIGIKPGDRVATLAWNSYRHLELYYGISE